MVRAAIKTESRTEPYEATVLGEPASKANSRRLVSIHGTSRFIKSDKALNYVRAFQYQVRPLTPMFEKDVCVSMRIFYATRRPDLDATLIFDALQGRVYTNDRQVKECHLYWGLDPKRPRVELRISPLPA